MPKVKLSRDNRITIPSEVMREVKLRQGEPLLTALRGEDIYMFPLRKLKLKPWQDPKIKEAPGSKFAIKRQAKPGVTIGIGNRITIPSDIVGKLKLNAGDTMLVDADMDGDCLCVLSEPEDWSEYFRRRAEGRVARTKEEVARYLVEVRCGYEIEGLANALKADPAVRAVYEATSFEEARSLSEVVKRSGIEDAQIKLIKLDEVDAVKQLSMRDDLSQPYYRRIPYSDPR